MIKKHSEIHSPFKQSAPKPVFPQNPVVVPVSMANPSPAIPFKGCISILYYDPEIPEEIINKIHLEPGQEIVFGKGIEGPSQITCDNTVEDLHCCISRDRNNNKFWFTDLSTPYGSYIRIPSTKTYSGLQPGESILAGFHLIRFKSENDEKTQWLVKYNEKEEQVEFPKSSKIVIGKTGNIGNAADGTLSSKHAEIKCNLGTKTYTIMDGSILPDGSKKPSTNGTWLKIRTPTLLVEPQTQFKIGDNTYLYLF